MIRTVWVYVAGVVYTIIFASRVIIHSALRSPWMKEVCQDTPTRWSRGMLWFAGARVRLEGVENLRTDAPQIVVANHESWFDVWALAAHLPVDYRFVAKEELGRIPLFGRAWQTCGHVSINRGDRSSALESLDEASRKVRDEHLTMIMFPEGTRSADGSLQPFKKGAFVLALQLGVPLVPVGIRGTRQIMGKGSWKVRSGEVSIRVGEPIPVEGLRMADRDRLMGEVRAEVAKLKGEELSPGRGPGKAIPAEREE